MAVGQARLSRRTSRCTTRSTEDHGTPQSAHSRSAVMPHAEQMTLQRWRKKDVCTVADSRHFHTHHLSHTTLSHTHTHIHTYTHTYIHTCIHAYIHTYLHTYIHTHIHTYIRTCILSFHIPSCFVTHRLSHATLSHTTVLTSRSFTTSFVFPSFPVPATTFEAHYWKKLTCGVIRSFNFVFVWLTNWNYVHVYMLYIYNHMHRCTGTYMIIYGGCFGN